MFLKAFNAHHFINSGIHHQSNQWTSPRDIFKTDYELGFVQATEKWN
jgi:hypothetical protein